MIWTLLKGLATDALGGVTDHFKAKRERRAKEQEHVHRITEAKVNATIDSIARGEKADIDWDIQAQKNAATSWKDEWFTVILSIPLVMCFIPQLDQYVTAGFVALAETPEWYQAAVGLAIAASFGWRKFMEIRHNGGSKP